MRYWFTATACLFFLHATSQFADSLAQQFQQINQAVVVKKFNASDAMAISNRAMNIFLADKTAYLSESSDLSYFTNYVTANTALGKITINHNFQKVSGVDEPIKKLFSAGVSISTPVNFSNSFLDYRYDNGLNLLLSYKWLGKVKTTFTNEDQKKTMDALRAVMLKQLTNEISQKATEFEKNIAELNAADIPGQDMNTARAVAKKDFEESLKETYEEKFAALQATTLTKTKNFKTISTGWTNLSAAVPLVSPGYYTTLLNAPLLHKHSWPLSVSLSHTRFWESAAAGKLFITASASLLLNNSKLAYGLTRFSLADYIANGGTDTVKNKAFNNNKAYNGVYENFLTPSVTLRFQYFPGTSHIGVSLLAEQNFGKYKSLNGRIGLPVVLINSKKTPAVNFDFYVLFIDINNQINNNSRLDKIVTGLSIGIPMSRLMF